MKTPREILLVRHRVVAPKLHAIRNAIVSDLNNPETKKQSLDIYFFALLIRCLNKVWQELILPSRRTWAGLAAVWGVLAVINFVQRDALPASNVSVVPVVITLGEQQRLLNELFADRAPESVADRPKTITPQPRTELFQLRAV